jgi:hypothetical protein
MISEYFFFTINSSNSPGDLQDASKRSPAIINIPMFYSIIYPEYFQDHETVQGFFARCLVDIGRDCNFHL